MSERSVVRWARLAAGVGGALAVLGSASVIAVAGIDIWWSELIAFVVLLAVFFAAFAWLAIPQQPGNAVVRIMAGSAFLSGLYIAGLAAAALVVDDPELVLLGTENVVPAELPTAARFLMVFEPAFVVGMFSVMTFGLLLFPDGRLPSAGWRWVGWFAGASIVTTAVAYGWGFRPGNTSRAADNPVLDPTFVALMLAVVLCFAALLRRYRSSRGERREQFKWIAWGTSVFVPVLVLAVSVGDTEYESLAFAPLMIGGAVFVVSYGIAVTKYRLYEIDVVISKTVTYGALAAFIAALYAAVVVGLGNLLDRGDEPDLALSIAATALIAVLFEPIHRRVARLANRLVYGERATPYAVLSTLSARLTGAGALYELAELVASGTGAETAGVWLRVGDDLRLQAQWPADAAPRQGAGLVVPVSESGEELGAITVAKAAADPVTDADRRLVTDVAAGAGLLLRNIRLSAELAERAEQLRASRRRLVAAHDAERHRLERDLHDGAQQQVVALKVKLGLAKTMAERESAAEVAAHVAGLADETQEAVDAMRVVARGIYPPLLEAEGLAAALGSVQRLSRIPVEVDADGVGRYPRHVEETVYFCVLEAIEGATMSGAHGLRVGLVQDDGDLVVQIDHDGRTVADDFAAVSDRVDAFGGSTRVDVLSGIGTRVTSRIPTAHKVMEPA